MISMNLQPTSIMRFIQILIAASIVPAALAGEHITLDAESFTKQTRDEKRRWEISKERPNASGGAYIQVLPDTRRTHDDKLIKGENFSDEPGAMAVLEYPFEVKEAGRYFVWARTWSSGTEDNGLHFGLDGKWPASGARCAEERLALGLQTTHRPSPHGRAHAALAGCGAARQTHAPALDARGRRGGG
jgi:hypothetical protein